MDNKKLNEYLKDAFITIIIIIFASFIAYRIGIWKGENNITIEYDIKVSDTTFINTSTGEEVRIPFRLFD